MYMACTANGYLTIAQFGMMITIHEKYYHNYYRQNATCTCTYLVKFIIECTLVKLTSSTVYGIFLVSILRTAATASGLKSPVKV